jgi:hypothetical protein
VLGPRRCRRGGMALLSPAGDGRQRAG